MVVSRDGQVHQPDVVGAVGARPPLAGGEAERLPALIAVAGAAALGVERDEHRLAARPQERAAEDLGDGEPVAVGVGRLDQRPAGLDAAGAGVGARGLRGQCDGDQRECDDEELHGADPSRAPGHADLHLGSVVAPPHVADAHRARLVSARPRGERREDRKAGRIRSCPDRGGRRAGRRCRRPAPPAHPDRPPGLAACRVQLPRRGLRLDVVGPRTDQDLEPRAPDRQPHEPLRPATRLPEQQDRPGPRRRDPPARRHRPARGPARRSGRAAHTAARRRWIFTGAHRAKRAVGTHASAGAPRRRRRRQARVPRARHRLRLPVRLVRLEPLPGEGVELRERDDQRRHPVVPRRGAGRHGRAVRRLPGVPDGDGVRRLHALVRPRRARGVRRRRLLAGAGRPGDGRGAAGDRRGPDRERDRSVRRLPGQAPARSCTTAATRDRPARPPLALADRAQAAAGGRARRRALLRVPRPGGAAGAVPRRPLGRDVRPSAAARRWTCR